VAVPVRLESVALAPRTVSERGANIRCSAQRRQAFASSADSALQRGFEVVWRRCGEVRHSYTESAMPIYEYRCERGHTFEVMQRMTDDPLTSCSTCESPVQRVFHPVAVHFKGSGFYSTDYGKKKAGASSTSDSSSKSDTTTDSKSESKDSSKSSSSESSSPSD
jgi:putative FmdB family regulatory protein